MVGNWLSSERKEAKWRYLLTNDGVCLIFSNGLVSKVQCESKTHRMNLLYPPQSNKGLRLTLEWKRPFKHPSTEITFCAIEKSGNGWWIEFLNTAQIHFLSVCLLIFCQLIDDETEPAPVQLQTTSSHQHLISCSSVKRGGVDVQITSFKCFSDPGRSTQWVVSITVSTGGLNKLSAG